jgi:hypothetical protein
MRQQQNMIASNVSPMDISSRYFAYFDSYARALLFPELCRNAKIPSIFPQETTSIHKHWTIPLTCTSGGQMALTFNPFSFSDTSAALTTLYQDASATLSLTAADTVGGSTGIAMSTGTPINTFANYRLVSCSVILTPQVSLQNAQGTIGSGIYFGQVFAAGATGSVTHYAGDQLTVSSNIDNLVYYNEANITALQSVRMIYFPADPSYEMYIQVNNSHGQIYGTDFVFAFYVNGASASAKFNLEIFSNYEMQPFVTTEQYMPTSAYRGNEDSTKVVKSVTSAPAHISQIGSNILGEIESLDEGGNANNSMFQQGVNFLSNHSSQILEGLFAGMSAFV